MSEDRTKPFAGLNLMQLDLLRTAVEYQLAVGNLNALRRPLVVRLRDDLEQAIDFRANNA